MPNNTLFYIHYPPPKQEKERGERERNGEREREMEGEKERKKERKKESTFIKRERLPIHWKKF